MKKTDLAVDPKVQCEYHTHYIPELLKEFGINITAKLEENGCVWTAKLK